mmetsp:Transcript_35590/g.100733  ORF Transcript_35590/g.100733 Transcript_35590/m.100733 type:complete len:256 (+) Transcript_35590:990-1757(+)
MCKTYPGISAAAGRYPSWWPQCLGGPRGQWQPPMWDRRLPRRPRPLRERAQRAPVLAAASEPALPLLHQLGRRWPVPPWRPGPDSPRSWWSYLQSLRPNTDSPYGFGVTITVLGRRRVLLRQPHASCEPNPKAWNPDSFPPEVKTVLHEERQLVFLSPRTRLLRQNAWDGPEQARASVQATELSAGRKFQTDGYGNGTPCDVRRLSADGGKGDLGAPTQSRAVTTSLRVDSDARKPSFGPVLPGAKECWTAVVVG